MLLRFHIFPDTTKMKAAFKQLSCREKTREETPDVAKTQPANAGWDSHLPSVGTGKYSGRDFFPLFQQRLLGGRMNSQSLRHGPLCSFFLLTPCAESDFFFNIFFSSYLLYCSPQMNGNGSEGVFQSHKWRNTAQDSWTQKQNIGRQQLPPGITKRLEPGTIHESMSFPQNWWGKEQATAAMSSFLANYSLEKILLLMFINANKFLNQTPVDCSETRDAFGEGNYALKQVLWQVKVHLATPEVEQG